MRGRKLKDKQGAVLVLVAITMTALFGFAALSIDIGNLTMVRNQLQNAADAGALAGAGDLYNNFGTAIQESANQTAYDVVIQNMANSSNGVLPAESNWTSGNTGDIQRGHWSFATRTFTPNDSLEPVELGGRTTEELDVDPDFINAVRVITRRETNPAASYFARVLSSNFDSFDVSAEAVAYLAFAGELGPGEADQPIAICAESIKKDDVYSCNIGRMINSGNDSANKDPTSNTGGWTSFSQVDPCNGGTNSDEMKALVCSDGNPNTIVLGQDMATTGGELQSVFANLFDCWSAATGQTQSWNLTLPVISCPGNNVGVCEEVVGAVNVNVVWIVEQNDPHFKNAPTQMDGWSFPADAANTNGQARWASFVEYFNLKNVDGSAAPYQNKAIYFRPDCTPHELKGTTGGENFGILADRPVLVN